tara:strand:- start:56 stop:241 length:186 start_codon:yes stop_codon:yes gene_type:complete
LSLLKELKELEETETEEKVLEAKQFLAQMVSDHLYSKIKLTSERLQELLEQNQGTDLDRNA